MPTRQIFNARTQQTETAEMSVDHNNEIVATFKDGSFVKFPAGLTREQFEDLILAHEADNTGQEPITEESLAAEAELKANSNKLIGNTMPQGAKTNASSGNETSS